MYVYVHMCDVHRKSICKRCITTVTELKEIELGEVCETHDDYIISQIMQQNHIHPKELDSETFSAASLLAILDV